MSVNSIDRTLEPAGKCWVGFREISESLLGDLKAEPFAGARARGPEALGSCWPPCGASGSRTR